MQEHNELYTEGLSVYPVVYATYVIEVTPVSGDGCCGSPGYSTKYAIYSLMDSATDLILDYSLVYVKRVVQ